MYTEGAKLMDLVEAASIIGLGMLVPIIGILFMAARRQARPETLQRILARVVVVSTLLQIANFSTGLSLLRKSLLSATLFVMIGVGAVVGLSSAIFLRWRQMAKSARSSTS